VKPSFLGTKDWQEYPISELVPYIDWNPFFATWQLRGKYPNRGYPKIFNDQDVGVEAKKLFDDAQAMLNEIVAEKSLTAKAVIAFYPAHSVGDDIEIFEDEEKTKKLATFFGLRQQSDNDAKVTYAYGDFIAPKESGVKDYLGFFALSAGFGVPELEHKYKQDDDDYKVIMAKALADRLAEAFAEKMHEEVRRTHWGYSTNENLSLEDKLKVKYEGIRPAPGYPSQPDHTEKTTMWNLLEIEKKTGIQLTESLAMWPAAAVSGLYFANKESKYFAVGKIDRDQVDSYASRKKISVTDAERILRPILGYE